MITLVNIISIAIALLSALSQQPFVPPEVIELLLLAVAVLALVKSYLEKHLPQSLRFLAK